MYYWFDMFLEMVRYTSTKSNNDVEKIFEKEKRILIDVKVLVLCSRENSQLMELFFQNPKLQVSQHTFQTIFIYL